MTLVESALFELQAQDIGLYEAKQIRATEELDSLIRSYERAAKSGAVPPDAFGKTGLTFDDLIRIALAVANRKTATLEPEEATTQKIEIFQTVMPAIFKAMQTYDPTKGSMKPGNWVMTAADDAAAVYIRDYFRKLNHEDTTLDAPRGDEADGDTAVEQLTHSLTSDDPIDKGSSEPGDPNGLNGSEETERNDALRRLHEIFDQIKMSEIARKVLEMKFGTDGKGRRSANEIAAELGTTPHSVDAIYSKTLAKLQMVVHRNRALASEMRDLMNLLASLREGVELDELLEALSFLVD